MTLYETILKDLNDAMKARETMRVDALRLLKSALQNYEIERRGKGVTSPMSDKECEDILRREIKKRKEASELYKTAGREDLSLKETQELIIFERYLPPSLSNNEIKSIVEECMHAMGEVSEKDFGKIMKEVMGKTEGRADGKVVSEYIRAALNS